MRRVVPAILAMALLAGLGFSVYADDTEKKDESPKVTIKSVMKKANGKKGLVAKISTGKATDAEKKEWVKLAEGLAAAKPPRGEADSWKKLTDEIVSAAKDSADGKKEAYPKVKTTWDCGGCHKNHKPA